MMQQSNVASKLDRVLIANRGEIAVRLIQTCQRLSITSIAIYTEEDDAAPHVKLASEAFALDGKGSRGYLDSDNIIEICKAAEVQGVLPGYGFLSENSAFAAALESEGIMFIGPTQHQLIEFGLKHRARELAIEAKVPVVPGTNMIETVEEAFSQAENLGHPVMVKATAGGGGMGLQVCRCPDDLEKAFHTVKSRGTALFKESGLFMEKYVESGRHIEVQIFGNGLGDILWLGERECSIQRRHQKVFEETPSPFVIKHPSLRGKLRDAAVSLAQSVQYKSAGTVEFLVDDETGDFYFLEMNTRLQVEHGVTELCYQVDLVELMLLQAQAELLGKGGLSSEELLSYERDGPDGHAIEVRLYAENPAKDFAPSPGMLQNVVFPAGKGIRIDTWIETGTQVSPQFDPLLAKIIVHEKDRPSALELLAEALSRTIIQGPPTNLEFLKQIVAAEDTKAGKTLTTMLDTSFTYRAFAMEFIDGGAYTTVQDWPGRIGYLHGVPRSGPMDDVSFRIANLLAGNEEGTEGLEITFIGPKIKFHSRAVVALCGAPFDFTIDKVPVALWERHVVEAGSVLEIGNATGDGLRSYLAIFGGLPSVAEYLGSKSTTPSLNWGGYQGRILKAGDFLYLSDSAIPTEVTLKTCSLPDQLIPTFEASPTLYSLAGPYDDEKFLTRKGKQGLCDRPWKIGINSTRGGVRLEGPPPEWGRSNGGEGGSHPSNVLSYGYSIGGVSFTGDQGIVFPVDGADLSGFLCTHTVIKSEWWRLGQVKPGNSVRFKYCSWEEAMDHEAKLTAFMEQVASLLRGEKPTTGGPTPIAPLEWPVYTSRPDYPGTLYSTSSRCEEVESKSEDVTLRQFGERGILFEWGFQETRMNIQAKVQLFRNKLKDEPVKGISTAAFASQASLLVWFDPKIIDQSTAVRILLEIERSLPDASNMAIPSRIFRFPFLFDAEELHDATQRYMKTVRPYAVYLPDNIEFLRRVNGLKTREDVFEAVCGGKPYLVLTVGWLMALPMLRNLDPRRRIRAPKANPPRTYTPGGALGLAGDDAAMYPTDSPGGLMLWGLTIPGLPWDQFGTKPGYTPDKPWLFEDFDQVIFEPVSRTEFTEAVRKFKAGKYEIKVEHTTLDVPSYNAFVESVAEEVAAVRKLQDECDLVETEQEKKYLKQWEEEKALLEQKNDDIPRKTAYDIAAKHIPVVAPMNANLWQLLVKVGDVVESESKIAILEAMKMEIVVRAPSEKSSGSGPGRYKVVEVLKEGAVLDPGEAVAILVDCD